MRYLIIVAVFAISCNVQRQQVKTTETNGNTEVQVFDGDTSLCDKDFKVFLKDNLKYIKPPSPGSYVLLKRDDELVRTIKTTFMSCLIGKSPQEIVDLFGRTIMINGGVRYSSMRDESENLTSKMMLLIFDLDGQKKVKGITYREQGYGIEGEGEPSILDEEKKEKKKNDD